jgi:AcrR family transcriptional regulator
VGGKPVQARSVATRAALLDAAVECVCADGYAAVTTTEIARRAGVSRGAQLHHFPTKAALMAAAVEHLLQRRLREFAAVLASAPPFDRLDVAVDVVWTMFQGPAFVAWAELWIAARTDRDLAATMVEVDRRFTDESRLMFVEVASSLGSYDPGQLEMARDFAFALMTGVALQRLVPRGQRPASDYLDVLKAMAQLMLTDRHREREK